MEITDEAGRPLRVTKRFIHVRAGQTVRVKVVPQPPMPGRQPVTMSIVVTDAFKTIVPPQLIAEGEVHSLLTHLLARWRGRVPIPRRANLHLTLAEPDTEPLTLSIPFAVWPSRKAYIKIAIVGIVLGLLWGRFQEASKTATPLDAIIEIATNSVHLFQTGLLAGIVLFATWLFGWTVVWLGAVAADAE
jgi:hypothetical protein